MILIKQFLQLFVSAVLILVIMEKSDSLRSVIQVIAQHAVSGLSFMHPHLGEECKKAGISLITVNLLGPGFEPRLSEMTAELELSIDALRNKYKELLAVESISVSTIRSTNATFTFLDGQWPSGCYIEIVSTNGKKIEIAVDESGKATTTLNTKS